MASAVLSIAGSSVPGPFGALVGGAIGSVFDSFLFPGTDQIGPRLDDLEVQVASEGSSILVYQGKRARGAGTVLYASDFMEVERTESVGGSGGVNVTNFEYFSDAVVAIGRGATRGVGRPISRVTRVLADGKTLLLDGAAYDSGQVVIGTGDLSVQVFTVAGGTQTDPDDGFPDVPFVEIEVWLIYRSVSINFLDEGLQVGTNVTVDGFFNATLNGTRIVHDIPPGESGMAFVTLWGVYRHYAFGMGEPDPSPLPASEAAGAAITITQTPGTLDETLVSSVTILNGTDTQDPTAFIEAHDEIDVSPAYTGTALAQFDALNVTQFGNRFPSISFEVEADEPFYTRAEAIADILQDFGFDPSEYDTSNVSGEHVGSVRRGLTDGEPFLAGLLLAYDIYPQESGGVLSFFDWANLPTVVISEADLAAHEFGGDAPRPVTFFRERADTIPAQVDVQYLDSTKGLERGSQSDRSRSVARGATDSTLKANLPIVLTPSEAKTIARRLRLVRNANSVGVELMLPPSYSTLTANDMLSFTVDGEGWLVRAESVQDGANGLIRVRAVREEASAHSTTATAEDALFDPPTVDVPVPMLPRLLDIAPMADEDATVPGYYLGAALSSSAASFSGGAWYESRDGGTNYSAITTLDAEIMSGRATTQLLSGPTNIWDKVSTVDVEFIHGIPTTKTELQVLGGANWFLIGDEIVGIATWALVSGTIYRGSVMLRGVRNTEARVTVHEADERTVLVTASLGRKFETLAVSDFGNLYRYKAAESGFNIDDALTLQHQHTLATIRPFGPYDIQGVRDGSDNLTVTWRPRTRAIVGLWTDSDVPLLEESETYELDVLDGVTVVRTISGSSTRTITYTAAQQTADGLTPGDPVVFKAYQISSRGIGRGNVTDATV